ncbi:hypothetical protein MKX03_016644 [Papaver bracteatum]|nr:hypothetical protein MKX03_016644 [Papaver bracteatum]
MEHPPRKTSVLKAADEGKLEQLKKCASELDHELGVGLPTILGNIRNEDSGRRALHFAAAGGRLDVLKYLIEDMKLNIDVQDNSGISNWGYFFLLNLMVLGDLILYWSYKQFILVLDSVLGES